MLAAGGNATITEGGALAIASGGDVEIRRWGAGVIHARSVAVGDGLVGVVLGRDVTHHDTRVLLGTREAAVLGAAAGAVFAFLRILFGRRAS